MILKRIAPLSLAKMMAILYAILGLLFGALISVASLLGAFAAASHSKSEEEFGFLFGAGAIVILPVFYGALGGIGGLIMAFLYNVIARVAGGVEIELEPKPA